jgi:hypothetical protein
MNRAKISGQSKTGRKYLKKRSFIRKIGVDHNFQNPIIVYKNWLAIIFQMAKTSIDDRN